MNIAFVFAPYRHKRFSENIKVVDDDFGVFPPLNLAYAAAIAEQAGHRVIIIDANAERLSEMETVGRLRVFGADAVGLYFSTYMFHDTLAYAQAIKDALGVPILAGGINVLLYPRQTLAHRAVDFGVMGQALHSLPALLSAIEQGSPPDIPGVCYRQGDEVVIRPEEAGALDLDELPFPARHLLPNERYFSITSQLRNFTIMVTTTGCHQNCSFCAIAPLPFRARSAENVLDEMQECVTRHGVREIDFFDSDFPYNRTRTERICRGILERGLHIEWSCRACIDSIDRDLMTLMHQAGCRKIYLGLETPDSTLLKRMNKRLALTRVAEVIKDARDVGIRPLGFFMTGVPGESRGSLLRTILYSLKLNLDFAQFSRTVAKPGSALSAELSERFGYDYWADHVLGMAPERRLDTPWTSLSSREIEVWTKCAYLTFYYRPSFILRALRQVRSTDELTRGVRTALRMLTSAIKKEDR